MVMLSVVFLRCVVGVIGLVYEGIVCVVGVVDVVSLIYLVLWNFDSWCLYFDLFKYWLS